MSFGLQLTLIGFAGAFGAILRFGVGEFSKAYFSSDFPLGTLIVNLIGCFLLGIVAGMTTESFDKQTKSIVGSGFLGALTTFSTFSVETIQKAQEGKFLAASMNVGLNLVLGLLLAGIGMAIGKWISKSPS